MSDLGYPKDAITLVGSIYSESHTTFTGPYFGQTKPIPIQRGTIQGDTLSPYLFINFLKPLLRWLDQDHLGYSFKTSSMTISSVAYADDLAVIFKNIKDIQSQLNKIDKFYAWASMGLGIYKCAITGCPNKSKVSPTTFKAYLQSHNIQFRNQVLPILHQNEPYKYLGIQLAPSFIWKIQIHSTMTKIKEQSQFLKASPATMKQKIHMTDSVIRAGIAYGFYTVAFSLPTINKLDKILIRLQKDIYGLPKSSPNVMTQLPHNMFGLEAFSLRNAYLRCIGEQLQEALNDTGRLGTIYQGLTNYVFAKNGGAQNILRITKNACVRSPITRTLFLLIHIAGTHIRSTHPYFPLSPTQLETSWITQAQSHHNINLLLCHHFLNKLLLCHITNLSQITLPNGTHLMTSVEFQTYYHKPTKIIQSALKLASQLFCHPTCTPQCSRPCHTHLSHNTLLPQFIIPNQQLPLAQPPPPIFPHIEDHLPHPPTHIWSQLKNRPITAIINHKKRLTRDHLNILKQYHSYLCTWLYYSGTTYAKWVPQSYLYKHPPHSYPLLRQYYHSRQTKYFTELINKSQNQDTRFIHPHPVTISKHLHNLL
jgi:hypothetical protein